MRKGCMQCVTKHLGQAWVLAIEANSDRRYREHAGLAIGHLAEAEAECPAGLPWLRDHIRGLRLRMLRQVEANKPITVNLHRAMGIALKVLATPQVTTQPPSGKTDQERHQSKDA